MDFDAVIDLLNQPPTSQDASTSTDTQEDLNAVNRAEPFQNNKRQTCLLFDGHTFSLHWIRKKSLQMVWRCCNRSCKGRLTTTADYNVVASTNHADECTALQDTAGHQKMKRVRILSDMSATSTKSLAQQNGHPYSRALYQQRRRRLTSASTTASTTATV